jgi:hypothetical protein
MEQRFDFFGLNRGTYSLLDSDLAIVRTYYKVEQFNRWSIKFYCAASFYCRSIFPIPRQTLVEFIYRTMKWCHLVRRWSGRFKSKASLSSMWPKGGTEHRY